MASAGSRRRAEARSVAAGNRGSRPARTGVKGFGQPRPQRRRRAGAKAREESLRLGRRAELGRVHPGERTAARCVPALARTARQDQEE